MTLTRGLALTVALAAAGALVHAGVSGSSTAPAVRLKAITSHSGTKGTSLVIEATEPVPYMTTRPDAMTVIIEFRDVDAQTVTKKLDGDAKSAIAGVTVENGDALGAPSSRVRIALSEAVAHHVRSEKNEVIVDFDKTTGKGGKDAPYVLPPAARAAASDAAVSAPSGVADPIAALNLQALSAPPAAQPAVQTPATQTAAPSLINNSQTPSGSEKRWTGMPISLIFDDADLKSVLEAIADQEGFNLSVDPDVRGTVNTHFVSVPWDQALDQILRSNKLGYVVDGTIVRIAPITTLATESDDRRKLADAQANEGELHTLAKTLSYAKADELVPVLMKSNTLSPRGTVQTDPRTNTLIITDLEARITSATDLIAILDRPQPQVAIEARIVQTNKNFERRMGVQWGFNGLANQALGNTTPLAFPNTINLAGSAAPAVAGGVAPAAVNLAAPGATSAVSLALGSVNGAFNLDVALSALETSGNGRVLSTPRVTTQNNIEAEMTQGTQIPIQTVSNNTVTVGFKDAALTLKVTPQITAAGTVIMAISLENSVPDFSRSVNGIPPINTQRANTKLLVNDGETTVIGGVYTSTQQNVHDTTPGLSKIPILSWFFKRDQIDDSNTELLIFITPRILKE
ncbi:MAG TPA: type IV pilus secretin PilQ [Vicinamibacterales bacterium]|nr:type IV pilus secretin PilQ [Vicinamibacterales bacterium]